MAAFENEMLALLRARLGNDPEHVQAFGPKSLVRALRREFRDVELHPCFPWLVAECRGPKGG